MPVVHDGSSSVFYPGKLIFFCRALPYPARYGIYIAIHIPIAAAGTYWFSRTLKAGQIGATLSAMAFAFSGYVLFQTTNVVYLVSAAWLPFALCSVWLMFRQMKFRWAIWTATFCALMILGGDPQMCYHVGLVMAAFGLWKFLRTRRRHSMASNEVRLLHRPYRQLLKSGSLIFATILVTFGLAAIQILPSFVWSQGSIRTQQGESPQPPRNIYEAMSSNSKGKDNEIRDGLTGAPLSGSHHDHIYQFSQPPWTLIELMCPNISGKPYPVHQRWVDGLPGAERMWTPSIYSGCFVLVLGLIAFNPFSKNRKYAWLSRIALFFTVASFGWYGPVWLINEFAPKLLADQDLGAPVGGLYWLMVVLLPKYVAFRYPAKLVVLATLAISVLAGLALERTLRTRQTQGLSILAGLFMLLSVGILLFGEKLTSLGGSIPSDLFGPFDASNCKTAIQYAAVTSMLVIFLCTTACQYRARTSGALVLLICSLELLLANSWLVPTVNQEVFEAPNRWTQWSGERMMPIIVRNENHGMVPQSLKIKSPPRWTQGSSPERLSEIAIWQRNSLHAKHHLDSGIQLLGSFYSLEPFEKPYRKAANLEGSYFQIQSKTGQTSTFRRTAEYDAMVQSSAWNSHVDHSWSGCNQLELEIRPTLANPGQSPYSLNLQPVSGWAYVVRDQMSGKVLQAAKPIRRDNGRMNISVPANRPVTVSAHYQPLEFFTGAWISAIAWSVFVLASVIGRCRAFALSQNPARTTSTV